ncbi:MAG: AMP-binding protein [Acidimicrobiales bacterium]|nr:AMP-binding protein [Acidimicrobiales bacterium]
MYPGAHAASTPDRPAIIMASAGTVITYAELDRMANQISRLLRDIGVQVGDHVAFCMENHRMFLPIAWGCRYAGAIFTALSSRLTTDEMEYIVDNCGAKVFITSKFKAYQAGELTRRMPGVSHRYMLDGTVEGYLPFDEALRSVPAEPLADRIAGHDMLYSSGTTGRPKGVLRTLPPEPLEQADHPVSRLQSLLFAQTADSVYLSPAPLYHAAPLRFSMGSHVLGSTVVVMERFDPAYFLDLVSTFGVTHMQMVPTMFVRLLKLEPAIRNNADMSSLETIIHAAAPCPVAVKEQMIDWLGPILHEYYAGTEGNGIVYCNSEMWLAHPGTVGLPINCEIHICDDSGEELPVGDEGTVYFGGGGDFEYHQDPAKTASSRHPSGWSTLGDIGRLDGDGFLYLTDRKAHMIISGGVNVYPQEAENVLTMHPEVADVAVIGVPNEEFGEEVKAVVQPAPGVTADARLERELIMFCRERLADVKCPRSVDFRDELPRHPTGKLYKRLLKDEYWADVKAVS